jgi:hypothetical protein
VGKIACRVGAMSPDFARFCPRSQIARLDRVGTALLRSWGEIEIVDRAFAHSTKQRTKVSHAARRFIKIRIGIRERECPVGL